MNTMKYNQTSHNFTPRYHGPSLDEMTNEQLNIYNSIVAARPRTGISGPFGPWLSVPQIADPAQKLGQACRYGTSLSPQESELVILLTAAKHKSHAEFDIHVGEALKVGLCMDVIESIPRDDEFSMSAVKESLLPKLVPQSRDQMIVQFVSELLESATVCDATYKAAKNVLTEDSVLVEITSIVGYYTFCAYTLNVFQIPTREMSLDS
mmetsp:Transcript_9614/g.18059  ORF Transcript_9614/g.18059 Transcript_9614/m.18059 type:complete len:208 (+) Transcript_9614:2443-3066(+)